MLSILIKISPLHVKYLHFYQYNRNNSERYLKNPSIHVFHCSDYIMSDIQNKGQYVYNEQQRQNRYQDTG